MTEARVSQAGVEALQRVVPGAQVSQAGVEVLFKVTPAVAVSQAGIEYLHRVTPTFAISQAGVEVLHKAVPCGTRWCQIWTITRADGTVYRFTSLDRDLVWPPASGVTYKACSSLVPSASEAVAELGSSGTMDLSGAIGDGGIAARDLYGGLLDGAGVEAWLVSWQGEGTPHRLLYGNFGPVEHDRNAFKTELVGDGERLQQTPLVRLLQPGCWKQFGDAFCTKALGPLTVTGTVAAATGQRAFTDPARAEPAGYFTRGVVTFTSGLNAGIGAEIKAHAAGGAFTLWPRLAYPIAAGDSYSMVPGCTNIKAASGGTNGCTAWDNEINYGGFDKVPGRDKRGKAAEQRGMD